MSAFARAAELFEELSGLPAEDRAAALEREPNAEVRALAAEMLAGESDPHTGLETGLPGIGHLVADALEDASGAAERAGAEAAKLELADSPYRVLGVLARGGMGIVLRGRDEEIGRNVAIKVLRDHDRDGARLRFIEEAQVAGQLEHPGIVPIYHLGEDDAGRPFFAMKLVEGETLAECLDRRGDARDERARYLGLFLQVCQTVAYAHSRQVIHRDLKPANVMVGAFGEVQVLDWGLAKVLGSADLPVSARSTPSSDAASDSAPETVRTRTESGSASVSGTVMGTPRYMPPEQAQGEVERLDRRSDVFSLGAILCEILTGEPPFPGARREALDAARAGRIEPALERLASCGADPAIIALARRSLAVSPAERPADASELAAGIEHSFAAVEERTHAAELAAEAARASAVSERRARRLTSVLTASAAVFAVVLVSVFLWRAYERERDLARSSGEVEAALNVASERFDVARQAPPDARAPWDAAALAVEAAESILAGGDATAAVRARVTTQRAEFELARSESEAIAAELQRDSGMVARLEEIRLPTGDGADPYDYPYMEASYRAAFADYGIDIEDDFSARARLVESDIARELGQALDQWGLCHRTLSTEESTTRVDRFEHLMLLASAADPDPLRDRVRAAIRELDSDALLALGVEAQDSVDFAPESILLIAAGLRAVDEHSAAVDVLRPAVRRHRGDFWLSFHTALVLRAGRDGNYMEESVAYFHGALGARPDCREARHLFGQTLHQLGRLEEARAVFEELNRTDADYGHGLAHTGEVIFDLEGWSSALPVLTEAARLAPEDPYTLTWYGRALEETGSRWQAMEPMRRAYELDPDADAAARFATTLSFAGHPLEAAEMFAVAYALDPDLQRVLYSGGTLARQMGDLELALELLTRCTELYPGYARGWCNLGAVLRELGRYEEARSVYARCDSAGRRTRGWEYPSDEWLAFIDRALILAAELDVYAEGEFDPTDEAFAIDLAEIAFACERTATASNWYAEIYAVAGDLVLADMELAAAAATRACAGDGTDAQDLTIEERAAHGELALFWLREIHARLMPSFREDPVRELDAVRSWFEYWKYEPHYAALREPDAQALPTEELRRDVERFWIEIEESVREIDATFEGDG